MRSLILLSGLMLTSIDTAIGAIPFRDLFASINVVSFREAMVFCAAITGSFGVYDALRQYTRTGRYRVFEMLGPYKEEWRIAQNRKQIEFQLTTHQAFEQYLKLLAICPYCKNRDTQKVVDELSLSSFNKYHMGPFAVYTCKSCSNFAKYRAGAHSLGGTSQHVPDVTWHFSLVPENHNKVLMPVLDRDEETEQLILNWHEDFISRRIDKEVEQRVETQIAKQVAFHRRAA